MAAVAPRNLRPVVAPGAATPPGAPSARAAPSPSSSSSSYWAEGAPNMLWPVYTPGEMSAAVALCKQIDTELGAQGALEASWRSDLRYPGGYNANDWGYLRQLRGSVVGGDLGPEVRAESWQQVVTTADGEVKTFDAGRSCCVALGRRVGALWCPQGGPILSAPVAPLPQPARVRDLARSGGAAAARASSWRRRAALRLR